MLEIAMREDRLRKLTPQDLVFTFVQCLLSIYYVPETQLC